MPEEQLSASLKILPFQWRDLDAIMKIENQVFSAPWSRESYAQLARQPAISLWVAKSDEDLHGYMLYQLLIGEMELHTLAVHPSLQGKGIGKALMQKLLAEASQHSVQEIYLQVRVSNARAIWLYEHFNFAKAGLRKRYYQDNGEDAYIMRLRLFD